jgi:hypothetical protein
MSFRRRLPAAAVFQLIVLGYVLIQVYAVWRAYSGLALPGYALALLGAWVVLMTFSLPLEWRLERGGWHRTATVLAWIGFGWMGWVFLFFWIGLALSALSALLGALALPNGMAASAVTLGSFPVAAGVALLVSAYGFLDARHVRVERVRLASPKLAAGSATFRLALISDVHLGPLVGARRLRRLIEQLRELNADVLVSAGDLVDGLEHRLRELAPMFGALQPRYGKFAVTGNHEYYAGLAHALQFHRLAGFHVLQGEAIDVTPEISIAGVDDPTGRTHPDERVPLAKLARERFKILLKHQPVLRPDAQGMFDLQLSGHVHQGQIFPFGLLVRLAYPARTGLTPLARGGWLYVSRGTGTWGPPMRVAAPPEITLIEIEAQ